MALGFDSFNFYGVSYGTELGQFVMRRHPEHLRSAVLDAVVPLDYNLFTEPAFAQQRIAEKYFDACAAQPACDAAYPDLADRYLALIDRLNADPVPLTVTPLDAMEPRQILLTGDLLEEAIYGSLYMNVQEVLPLIIDRADKGDFTIASAFLLPMTLFDTSVAEGMYMAVSCADRGDTDLASVAFPDVLPRLATSTRTEAETALEICRDWG